MIIQQKKKEERKKSLKKSPKKKQAKTRSPKRSMPKTSDLLGNVSPNAKFLAENLYALSIASNLEKGKKKKFDKCSDKNDCEGSLVCISSMCQSLPKVGEKKITPDDILSFLFSKHK